MQEHGHRPIGHALCERVPSQRVAGGVRAGPVGVHVVAHEHIEVRDGRFQGQRGRRRSIAGFAGIDVQQELSSLRRVGRRLGNQGIENDTHHPTLQGHPHGRDSLGLEYLGHGHEFGPGLGRREVVGRENAFVVPDDVLAADIGWYRISLSVDQRGRGQERIELASPALRGKEVVELLDAVAGGDPGGQVAGFLECVRGIFRGHAHRQIGPGVVTDGVVLRGCVDEVDLGVRGRVCLEYLLKRLRFAAKKPPGVDLGRWGTRPRLTRASVRRPPAAATCPCSDPQN